jgi:serine/threonine protein kinase
LVRGRDGISNPGSGHSHNRYIYKQYRKNLEYARELAIQNAVPPHPHLMRLTCVVPASHAVLMPFLGGGDLWQDGLPQGASDATIAIYAAQLVLAVATLHRAGYVHHDIKPQNVVRSAGTSHVALIDFGLAVHVDDVNYGRGTKITMAPEVARIKGYESAPLHEALDWWSVGATIYMFHTLARVPLHSRRPGSKFIPYRITSIRDAKKPRRQTISDPGGNTAHRQKQPLRQESQPASSAKNALVAAVTDFVQGALATFQVPAPPSQPVPEAFTGKTAETPPRGKQNSANTSLASRDDRGANPAPPKVDTGQVANNTSSFTGGTHAVQDEMALMREVAKALEEEAKAEALKAQPMPKVQRMAATPKTASSPRPSDGLLLRPIVHDPSKEEEAISKHQQERDDGEPSLTARRLAAMALLISSAVNEEHKNAPVSTQSPPTSTAAALMKATSPPLTPTTPTAKAVTSPRPPQPVMSKVGDPDSPNVFPAAAVQRPHQRRHMTTKAFQSIMTFAQVPAYFSPELKSLLKLLMHPDPNYRRFNTNKQLTLLKRHPYFRHVDWAQLPQPDPSFYPAAVMDPATPH